MLCRSSGGAVVTWAKLDDSFPEHLKVIDLTDGAFRLYVEGLCYAARNLTDGALPKAAVRRLTGGDRRANELVAAGLWDEDGPGWVIHDYLDFNPSAGQVNAERAAARERKARSRSRSKPHPDAVSHGVTPPVTHAGSPASPSRPVPTRIEKSSSVTTSNAPHDRDDDDDLGRELIDAVVALKMLGARPENPGPYRAEVARNVPAEHGAQLRQILDEHPAWPANWVAAHALGLERSDPSPRQVIDDCPDCTNGLITTDAGMAVCPSCSWARNGTPIVSVG